MFKFLKDIKWLKEASEEILEEFNEDYVSTGWFSRRRTLQKRVADLETITDKLLGVLKLEANESACVPEQVIPEVPSTWSVVPKGTHAKKVVDEAAKEAKRVAVKVKANKPKSKK